VEEHKSEIAAPDPRQAVKRAYSTPRLSAFGSVEMLSLGGTGSASENPGNHSLTKKP
jgi:hypothetical protein